MFGADALAASSRGGRVHELVEKMIIFSTQKR